MKGYSVQLRNHARTLRHASTDAELRLWRELRSRTFAGYKFRRQHPIDGYIADFVCLEEQLVVELDGGQHTEQTQYDAQRTEALERLGFRVLRYWNNDVLTNTDGVLLAILLALRAPSP